MWRVLFIIPGLNLRLHSFSIMMLIACFGAVELAARRARRERLNPEAVYGLSFWLISGGFIGARLWFFIQNPGTLTHWTDLFKIWQGGIVFYGCIMGGLIGSVLYWLRHPFPFRAMADAVAPALTFGATVGRLGCFLNGCCYGAPCDVPWAMRFPAGTAVWMNHVEAGLIPAWSATSLPVHPKQLYAALSGLMILGLLLAYYPRRRRDGEVMVMLMITYPITRFLYEFYRGDAGGTFAGLAVSQYISLALLACGLVAWYRLSRTPAGRLADGTAMPPAPHLPIRLGISQIAGGGR
jgi:phosphatidylglycerol:prolipoprotein diacylglycerol transferase